MDLPSVDDVNQQRVARFKERIAESIKNGEGAPFRSLLEQMERELNLPPIEIAAALASLLQGDAPFLLASKPDARESRAPERSHSSATKGPRKEREHTHTAREESPPIETFRIEVGHMHKVQPGNIVGAIANEAGVEGRNIGRIEIYDDHSFVDLPAGMPKEIFNDLKKVRVCGVELRISRVDAPRPGARKGRRP
jgi:ATP-dependent RNA helicase DeaD